MPRDKRPAIKRAKNRTHRLERMRHIQITMTLEEAYLLKCEAGDGPTAQGERELTTLSNVMDRIESTVEKEIHGVDDTDRGEEDAS